MQSFWQYRFHYSVNNLKSVSINAFAKLIDYAEVQMVYVRTEAEYDEEEVSRSGIKEKMGRQDIKYTMQTYHHNIRYAEASRFGEPKLVLLMNPRSMNRLSYRAHRTSSDLIS